MSNRLDATNCTHEAALARVAELESKLANAERDFQESYASAGKWQGLAVEYKSKLERASKFANANAEDVESLQGKVRELESLCSSQALRLEDMPKACDGHAHLESKDCPWCKAFSDQLEQLDEARGERGVAEDRANELERRLGGALKAVAEALVTMDHLRQTMTKEAPFDPNPTVLLRCIDHLRPLIAGAACTCPGWCLFNPGQHHVNCSCTADEHGLQNDVVRTELARSGRDVETGPRLTSMRAERDSYAWLIEGSNGRLCIGVIDGRLTWVPFSEPRALRFSRKQDAEAAGTAFRWYQKNTRHPSQLHGAVVTEHMWPDPNTGDRVVERQET